MPSWEASSTVLADHEGRQRAPVAFPSDSYLAIYSPRNKVCPFTNVLNFCRPNLHQVTFVIRTKFFVHSGHCYTAVFTYGSLIELTSYLLVRRQINSDLKLLYKHYAKPGVTAPRNRSVLPDFRNTTLTIVWQ